MNDPTRIQHFSQVFGSDIKNHDYSQQNRLIQPTGQQSGVDSLHSVSLNKTVYESSRISMQGDQRKAKARGLHKPKTNWQDLIPPIPEDDVQRPSGGLGENRKSRPPPSMQELKSHGLELPTAYDTEKKPRQELVEPTKKKKVCAKCSNPIAGQFVRAMKMAYHIECFRCAECDKPCSEKFFAAEQDVDGTKEQVPLCEYDFFKRLDLICYNCNQALRASYIEAIGHKYHLEHFTCVICSKVFDSDESFYEHEKGIYCHYHYARLFASHCHGCGMPILKEFIEIFRGGIVQQWHPECYMCYNFWSVTITRDHINPPQSQVDACSIDLSLISRVWNVLYEFDVATATAVSLMLKYASSGNHLEALKATALLVLKIEALFRAFDALYLLNIKNVLATDHDGDTAIASAPQDDDDDDDGVIRKGARYKPLGRLPRKLSANLMNYLKYLKRSAAPGFNASDNRNMLALGTSIAQVLKLVIKHGLHNALEYNKARHSQTATDRFLKEVSTHTRHVPDSDPFRVISPLVPVRSKDLCVLCHLVIEESCIKFNKIHSYRWHFRCLRCSACGCLVDDSLVNTATFSTSREKVYCASCTALAGDPSCATGFEYVSKLMQMIYIDEIALVRMKFVLVDNPKSGARPSIEKRKVEQDYVATINDVKRMKSTRQQQYSKSAVRKSTIVVMSGVDGDANENRDSSRQGFESGSGDISKLSGVSTSTPASGSALRDLAQKDKLTLDDIHRIVAAEETKELIPNAYKHSRHKTFGNQDVVVTNKIIGIAASDTRDATLAPPPPKPKEYNRYYSELSTEEHFIIRHIAVVALARTDAALTAERLLELIPNRKPQTFWSKFKAGKKKYAGPKVFGAPLEELTDKYGIESTQAMGPKPVRIPAFIDDCVAALHQKDMSVEGIFRKNGNIKRLRELSEAINENPDRMPDLNSENQIQLSALMKKFLREMPDPLFSFRLYDIWIASQKYDDPMVRKRILKLVFAMLPKCNRDLLEILLFFFSWVASFAYIDDDTGSKMNSHNLATVLAPNMLYKKPTDSTPGLATGPGVLQANTEAGDGYFLSIEVVNALIDNQDEFTMVPEDIMEVYTILVQQNPALSASGKGTLTSKDLIELINTIVANNPDILANTDKEKLTADEHSIDRLMTPTVVKGSNHKESNKLVVEATQ